MAAEEAVAGPGAAEVERLLLADDLDAACAAVLARGEPDEESPEWARLRLFLLLNGRAGLARNSEAVARRVIPAQHVPPADLPALAIADGGAPSLEKAVRIEGRLEAASRRRAAALLAEGKATEAAAILEQTLAALVQSPETFHLYGRVSSALNRPSDTVFAMERAADLAPDDVAIRSDLGLAHIAVGEMAQAAAVIAGVDPDPARQPALYTAFLRALAESGGPDAATVAGAHARYAEAKRAHGLPPRPDRVPGVPPKVGFLWPHAVRGADFLMAALLSGRDPTRWTARLYANGLPRRFLDTPLARLTPDRALLDRMSDRQVAELIMADEVDILVSFAAHGIGGRLGVLDHCPALCHVEWAGGPWPTRHPAVDCILADPGCAPPGTDEGTDAPILRLPVTSASLGIPLAVADRMDRSRTGEPGITFGWFGPPGGISDRVAGAWARIVGQIDGSTLHLAHEDWRIGRARQRISNAFATNEVSHKRIVYDHFSGLEARLERWRQVDIALDSVPVGHLATTLEALAMGIPVVTVDGDRASGRQAASALRLVGLDRLIAPDLASYEKTAVELARAPDLLARTRARLPGRVRRSALADEASLTRAFEALLPAMLDVAARRGGRR